MSLNAVNINRTPARVAFSSKEGQKKQEKKYDNPIIPGFEYLDATKATALSALGAVAWTAAKIAEALEFEDMEAIAKKMNTLTINGKKIAEKHQGLKILSGAALAVGGLYFLATLPQNLYGKKKEVFVKKNEWDIYSRTNSAEQNIYEKMDTEAQTADEQRKAELAKNWLKMQTAKNQPPLSR